VKFALCDLRSHALTVKHLAINWIGLSVSIHRRRMRCCQCIVNSVKRPWQGADHSPPITATVEYAWSYASIPPYVFMAWYLVKHRGNFTICTLEVYTYFGLCAKRVYFCEKIYCPKGIIFIPP